MTFLGFVVLVEPIVYMEPRRRPGFCIFQSQDSAVLLKTPFFLQKNGILKKENAQELFGSYRTYYYNFTKIRQLVNRGMNTNCRSSIWGSAAFSCQKGLLIETDRGFKAHRSMYAVFGIEMPPMQDVLIVGKKAPIGPEAARRMADILSPEQYVVEKIDHPIIEALVIKRSLLRVLPKEKLIPVVTEEGGTLADEQALIKVQVSIVLQVSKSLEL